MQEIGRVVEIVGNMTKVEVSQKEICHKCPSESFCRLTTGNSRVIEAVNEIGAKSGDVVKIEIGSKSILASAFLVYIFPVIVLLVTGSLTHWISGSQNLAIIVGIIALGVSFLVIKFLDRRIARSGNLIPVIKEVKGE